MQIQITCLIFETSTTIKLYIMNEFTTGEKVTYIGRGFIGFDPECTDMEIIEKCPRWETDYKVKYKDIILNVMSHEIKL